LDRNSVFETSILRGQVTQTRRLNRGIWKRLEGEVRDKLSQDDTKNEEVHDVWVIAGPIFQSDPVPTLTSGIPIPDGFYKIIAYRRGYHGAVKAVSFIIPQEPPTDDIFDYFSSVDQIEALTGIDFSLELSTIKQDNLESVKRNFLLETID
jgi:endonuclease G, mitochondrial